MVEQIEQLEQIEQIDESLYIWYQQTLTLQDSLQHKMKNIC